MNLTQHFDAPIAAALETVLELHPELAHAIHYRVTHKRDMSDDFAVFSHRAVPKNHRVRVDEPLDEPLDEPQSKPQLITRDIIRPTTTPKPPREPKPKPEPKPRNRKSRAKPERIITPSLDTADQLAERQALPAYQSKVKPRADHPPIRIDTITHDGHTYITTHITRQLVLETPLANINMYRTGTAFLTSSARRPVIRRLEIGPIGMEPTVLLHEEDCRDVIEARLMGFDTGCLTTHDPQVTRITRLHHDGHEWMKFSEAMAIVAAVPFEVIAGAWMNPGKRDILKNSLYQWIYLQARDGRMPLLNIGERKGALARTIDILPLAGKKKGLL